MIKICSKCGEPKDEDKFYYNQCLDCRLLKQREVNKKRREKKPGKFVDYYGYAVGIVLGDFKWLNYK